ncbi:MAG: DUF3291 domain-containing protein [Rhizobium sp.]|nr:DUF3291 domain-containing protein [Rhizobium sp.]
MTAASHHLAIYNFGVHTESYLTATVQGFGLRERFNFEAADRAVGFVGRSGYAGEPGPESWGELDRSRELVRDLGGQSSGVSSLSLWLDIESLMAFTYAGVHADALKHARQWNERQAWPPLVLFWVKAGETPSWSEAVQRFELLADQWPGAGSPSAFKPAFTADGDPYPLDRDQGEATGC